MVTIKEMAKNLEKHEISLKHECSPLVREVLNTKRIALWEALLRASDFTDMDIVEVVKTGADLTDEPAVSPLFPVDWKPAAEGTLTFETSRPTWVSVQDVVLKQTKDRPRNQVNRSQSSATFTAHKQEECLCSCRYGSC